MFFFQVGWKTPQIFSVKQCLHHRLRAKLCSWLPISSCPTLRLDPDKLTHWIFVETHFFRLENWSTKTLKPSDQTSRNEGTDVCFRTGTLRWYRCLTFGRWLLGTNPRRHKQNLWTCFCFQDIAQVTDHPFESFEVSSFEMVFMICILWLGVGMTCWFMSIHSSSPSKVFSESRYCKGSKPHSAWSACLKAIMAGFGPAFNNGKPASSVSSVRVEAWHKMAQEFVGWAPSAL